MNILLVTNEFPPEMNTGGIGTYMHQLAHLLHNDGHKVFVISETNGSEFEIADKGFCINYLIPQSDAASFRMKALEVFENYVSTERIDLIESPEVQACALEIKKKYPGIPLVVKLHTPGVLINKVYRSYDPLFKKMRFVAGALLRGKLDLGYWNQHDRNKEKDPEYQICARADILLSPGKALQKWVSEYWKIPFRNIKIVPNPFSFNAELFNYPIERDTKTICFVGKLTLLKGMLTLTPALKKVLENHPEYKLVIIGRDEKIPGKNLSMQTWMMEEFKIVKEQIRFRGQLRKEEVMEVLGTSEISVVPSLWENYPGVILESMAAGAAVVASDAGGIPEMVEDMKTGLLFKTRKSNELAAALEKLIISPQLRERLAQNGRDYIVKKNSESEKRKALDIYNKVTTSLG